MKKILIYISIVLLILGSFIAVLIFNKNDINNSVVYIESIDEISVTSGTGFVYKVKDNKNYIVTSYHVVEGYNEIYVYNSDKKKTKAIILNYDEYTDIAVLKIQDKLNLKEIGIEDSDKVNAHDKVKAIGNSLGLENINNISHGKIINNKKEVTIETARGFSDLNTIEINIDVSYGNSGGPLLNKNNKVIGMMFVKEENKNIAYALPINFVMDMVRKLENNELQRPNLGAVMCNHTNTKLLNEYDISIENIKGVVLLELNKSGVLNKSGLQKGDVITEFNGIAISNVNQLRKELYKKEKGNVVQITYNRADVYHKINVEL